MEVRNGAFSERNYLNGTFLAGDFNETGFRLMQHINMNWDYVIEKLTT